MLIEKGYNFNEFSLKNKIFERAFALGFSACGITPVKEVEQVAVCISTNGTEG